MKLNTTRKTSRKHKDAKYESSDEQTENTFDGELARLSRGAMDSGAEAESESEPGGLPAIAREQTIGSPSKHDLRGLDELMQ